MTTARCGGLPRRAQQLALKGMAGNVRLLLAPASLAVDAAHPAGAGVDENPVETLLRKLEVADAREVPPVAGANPNWQLLGGFCDELSPVGGDLRGVHCGLLCLRPRADEGGLATRSCAEVEPTPAVLPFQGCLNQSQGNQLGPLVLDARQALSDRLELARRTGI